MRQLLDLIVKPFNGEKLNNDEIDIIRDNYSFVLKQLFRIFSNSPRLNNIFIKLLDLNKSAHNKYKLQDLIVYFLNEIIPLYFNNPGEFNLDELKNLPYTKNPINNYSHPVLSEIDNNKNIEDSFVLYYRNKYKKYENIYSKYCLNCPLLNKDLRKVSYKIFNSNIDKPTILFVGINPGTEEAKRGEPFVGKAGQLLRKYTEQLNCRYIFTNSIKCSTSNQETLKNVSEVPLIDIFKNFCVNNLIEEINQFDPDIIVVLGKGENRNLIESSEQLQQLINEKNIKVYYLTHPSKYIRENIDTPPEYEKFFSFLQEEIKHIKSASRPGKTNNNFEQEDINVFKVSSPDEIPDEYLLLDINILQETNEYLFITTKKDTDEIYYWKIPFSHTVYFTDRTNDIKEISFIENRENLNSEIIYDYKFYKDLQRSKLDEFKDIIESHTEMYKRKHYVLEELEYEFNKLQIKTKLENKIEEYSGYRPFATGETAVFDINDDEENIITTPTFFMDVEKDNNIPNILYSDTDSLFVFIDNYTRILERGWDLSKPEIVKKVYEDFIKPLAIEINDYLKQRWQGEVLNYCNVSPEWNTLDFKTEIVMDAIAFIDAKKRYFVNMLMDDKVLYDPPKVKITGFEVVRSDAAPFTKELQMDIIQTFIDYRREIEKLPAVYIERKMYWVNRYNESVRELNLKYIGIPSSWSKANYKKEPAYVLAAKFWNTIFKDELRPGKKSYRLSIKITNPLKLKKRIDEILKTKKKTELSGYQLKEIFTMKNPLQWIKEKINVIFVPPGIKPKFLLDKLKEVGIEIDFQTQREKVLDEKIKNFDKIISAIKTEHSNSGYFFNFLIP